MSGVINTALETDTDLNLGIVNIRVDSTTQSVQFSTNGPVVDILYNIKICDTSNHSNVATSGSLLGVSTTPVNFYSAVVDTLNQFAEIHIINLTYGTVYIACIALNDPSPMYVGVISKLS